MTTAAAIMKEPKPQSPAASGAEGVDIDHILDTAATLFAEFGFDGVSMREISRKADCATPSIYYHFTSKSDLYREVFAHKIEQTIDIINERISGLVTKEDRFRELIAAFFDMFTGDRTLLLLMQRDVIDAVVTGRRFLSKRQYDHFTSLIQRLASELTQTTVDNETAFSLGALIFGYCELSNVLHEIYDQRGEQALQQAKARLVQAALKLLR